MIRRALGGAAFAASAAALAYRAHALDRTGAPAAFAVGAVSAGAGAAYTVVLLAFFVPSVALSRLGRERKRALVDIAKGGARDAIQVLANGGVATACATAALIAPPAQRSIWNAAFAGAYAAATADTWGTEIGTLAPEAPRSIVTRRPLAPGLSGGVTTAGNLAEAGGALWLALVAASLFGSRRIGAAAFAGGICGALADSLLGEMLQERRWCASCARECETDPHHCGTPTTLRRGVPGFDNDAVNAAATSTGALVASLVARL